MTGKQKRVIKLIERQDQINEKLLAVAGLKLEYIDRGAYRNVYDIKGSGLIVKLPKYSGAEKHSRSEIDVLLRLKSLTQFKSIQKYLPKIYYINHKTGIIVMEKLYRLNTDDESRANDVGRIVCKAVGVSFEYSDLKSRTANYAKTKSGKIKIIDLALIYH